MRPVALDAVRDVLGEPGEVVGQVGQLLGRGPCEGRRHDERVDGDTDDRADRRVVEPLEP